MFRQAVWDEPLLIELSKQGRRGLASPYSQKGNIENPIPKDLRRENIPLPSLSEPQVIRHFIHLSQMNYGVDCGPYPLGSCTMKYNPKISQRLAANPCLRRLHPYQPAESVQGTLEILYTLSQMLTEITGTDQVSLLGAAGAHAEFLGALIMRKLIEDQGELKTRDEMLVPDSAHGTNPASAALAGFKVVKIPSDKDGLVNVEAIKAVASKKTVGMMLTVPNTLGLFEKNIREVSALIHEAGGLMYYDGANMNALLGRARPGDMGFDIVHMNLHKTFATPHGGGGPGAGPLGVKKQLRDYLPVPLISFDGSEYLLDYGAPRTIGMARSFYGNIGVLLRAYIYIMLMGKTGLRQVSEQATLAANYVLRQLDTSSYHLPFSKNTPRKHEFTVSVTPLKKKTGVSAMDIAKSILDEGLHASTTYFPLIVEEALMIEPTETESVEELDRYAEALNHIARQATTNPEAIFKKPRNTSIGRLDEVKASHPKSIAYTWRKLSRNGASQTT
ncbi:MAG: aminomethyl-transferring glycine dehydrogenase subunit GcvPB [Thaumarchaeota archaeon]|nr:aminomethyl-transferring glycine dehydrogenase subunit GcvPB [Nitrososphaerota archaeon]